MRVDSCLATVMMQISTVDEFLIFNAMLFFNVVVTVKGQS